MEIAHNPYSVHDPLYFEHEAATLAARRDRAAKAKIEREAAHRVETIRVAKIALAAQLDVVIQVALAPQLVEHGLVFEAFHAWREAKPLPYARERLERMGAAADRLKFRGVVTINFADVHLTDEIVDEAAELLKLDVLADAERVG